MNKHSKRIIALIFCIFNLLFILETNLPLNKLIATATEYNSLEPADNQYGIVSPVPTGSTVTMINQAPRLDNLQGKTIALVGGSFSASITHAVIRDMLTNEFGCKTYFMDEIGKGGTYNPSNPSKQSEEFQKKLKEYNVDAVISGNCGCGICTVKETGNALAAEVIGIPSVVVGANTFIAQIESTGYNRGVPVVRTATYPNAFTADETAVQQSKARDILYPQIVTALTTQITEEEIERIAGNVSNSQYNDTVFTGSYQRVQEFYKVNEMTDGLPVVPPTNEKVEYYLTFSGYEATDCVCEKNGTVLAVPPANRKITAYQVAVNAIMAGCQPEYMPICIAITRCFANGDFYKPLQSTHAWTPYVLINGPIAKELGISSANGMINEKANKQIGRFMSLAMINLAGYKIKENRMGTFGYMQPFVFAEDEQACTDLGWSPYHVTKNFDISDSVVTCGSTMTWGNSVVMGTNNAEDALQMLAYDITEKQQNALGNTNPRVPRMIMLTKSAAKTLSESYKTKSNLEDALISTAIRPLWMRTYAHYWANTGSKVHLNKSFDEFYNEIKSGKFTENIEADIIDYKPAPKWLSDMVSFDNIDVVYTMEKGHTGIVITGGDNRAEAQILPGGDCASYKVKLPKNWNKLISSSKTPSIPTIKQYVDDFNGTYEDLHCAEDDCDCLEPKSNNYSVVSPVNIQNTHNTTVFSGNYKQIQDYFDMRYQTDGLPIIPPTRLKLEKFMRYTPYDDNDVVAILNGRKVTAYQIAVNVVLSGCSAELLPVCIAIVEAMANNDYLNEISDGSMVPMVFLNGPVCRQIGIDNEQGMTTEENNICLGRFIDFALLNLAGIPNNKGCSFGSVAPLTFSENDEACLNVGWDPYNVQQGYTLNESTVTVTSFSMWGNNLTPATDLPTEIMKVIAWDITEKNLGGLGGKDSKVYSETERTILITPSVANALSDLYKSKEFLESDLIQTARRPMWTRAFAYYYSNIDSCLSSEKTLSDVYNELIQRNEEGAEITSSPEWINGITNPKIMTGSTMKAGNTRILVTGDNSRNKTQVIPGGKSVLAKINLPNNWDDLLTETQHKNLSSFMLEDNRTVLSAPIDVPYELTDGTYRILDPDIGETYLTQKGRIYYVSSTNTIYFYAFGAKSKSSIEINSNLYNDFIVFIENLGYNSSFMVNSGKIVNSVIRFSSNNKKPENNTAALTEKVFCDELTLHANNVSNSADAGGVAINNSTVIMSSTVKSFSLNLDGKLIMGESTANDFVTLEDTHVTINTNSTPYSKAIIGAENNDGLYRTVTFVMKANGTYEITYNTHNTLFLNSSAVSLNISYDENHETKSFNKSDLSDIYTIEKFFKSGKYKFSLFSNGKNYGCDFEFTDYCDRLQLFEMPNNCIMNISADGYYSFKFNATNNTLTVSKLQGKTEDVIAGDINNDGFVTSDDAIYLLHYTFEPEDYPVNQPVDFNNNGFVTSDDAIYLLHFTFEPELYPLY